MSIEALKSALPEYAKDLRLNLASVAAEAARIAAVVHAVAVTLECENSAAAEFAAAA